jgi:cytidylate kinase-like protein
LAVVTISSTFGSSGSVVAKELGDILAWRVLNRALTVEVATHLSVPLDLAEAHDERDGPTRSPDQAGSDLVSEGEGLIESCKQHLVRTMRALPHCQPRQRGAGSFEIERAAGFGLALTRQDN